MAELKRIGELLEGLVVTDEDGNEHPVVPIGDAPSPAMLLDPRITPPRALVESRLATVERQLAKEYLAGESRAFFTAERVRLQRLLRWNDLKDEIQSTRPEGCWCLGRGWRVLLPHEARVEAVGEVRLEEAAYPILASGDAVRYCDCAAGIAVRAVHAEMRQAEERRRAGVRVATLWESSGLSQEAFALSSKTWLDEATRRDPAYRPRASRVIRDLMDWLPGGAWLWLEGPNGRGKTMLAQILLARLAQDGRTVLFRSVPDLLDRIRLSYDERGTRTAELIRSLSEVDVLCLDDLGKERPTEWVRERLYALVNARYAAEKRTLFTSNLTLESETLEERLDVAVVERISQRCRGGGVVKLDGPNLRTPA
jgi:DNA replication protein DnaC